MMGMYPHINGPRSSTGPYPSTFRGIDLRYEMGIIMDEYGHYILIRHYDKSEYSTYWDDVVKEAVGGPAWEYTDHVTRGRKVIRDVASVRGTGLELPSPIGLITVPHVVFYVEWDTAAPYEITNSDVIIEFTWRNDRAPMADEGISNVTNIYNILEAAPLLCDDGRIEYYKCVTRTDIAGK